MKIRATRFATGVVVLLALLALAGVALAAACGRSTPAPSSSPRAGQQNGLSQQASPTADQVTRWVDRGLLAVMRRDRAAWRAALPVSGRAARQAADALYAHLAPLEWTGLTAVVTVVPSPAATFDIRIVGRPGGAGPPTRIVAERVLRVVRRGGRLVAVGDPTPTPVARRYLMAFHAPRTLRGPGVVCVYDATWRPLAAELAAFMPQARADVARLLGASGRRPIVMFVYSSGNEVAAYLGNAKVERKARFFSRLPDTATAGHWSPGDVGVLATQLPSHDPWTPHMLAHEVTHALTLRWFFTTRHQPTFLLEGMATAVENSRSFAPLRAEVTAGDRSMPLARSFMSGDLWSGMRIKRTELAYLQGAAFVQYVLHGWGRKAFRRLAVDIADSDLLGDAVKAAVRRDLHVSWPRFYADWKAYVMTLP